MAKISVSKAREKLSEVVEMSQSEPVELEHYGRRAAVIVSPGQYDEMLEALEESQDMAALTPRSLKWATTSLGSR